MGRKSIVKTAPCRICRTLVLSPAEKQGPRFRLCDKCRLLGRYKRLTPHGRERHIARVTRQQQANMELHVDYARRTYWHLKLKAIAVLGGVCAGCGERSPLVLSVNHVAGRADGDAITGRDLYRAVVRGARDGLDIRCLNCQLLWEYERGVRVLPGGSEFLWLREQLESPKVSRASGQ